MPHRRSLLRTALPAFLLLAAAAASTLPLTAADHGGLGSAHVVTYFGSTDAACPPGSEAERGCLVDNGLPVSLGPAAGLGGAVFTRGQHFFGYHHRLDLTLDDRVFGTQVGAYVCTDLDGATPIADCGADAGEVGEALCGPGIVELPDSADVVVVLVDGPVFQSVDCPGSLNTVGGTVGTMLATFR